MTVTGYIHVMVLLHALVTRAAVAGPRRCGLGQRQRSVSPFIMRYLMSCLTREVQNGLCDSSLLLQVLGAVLVSPLFVSVC